MLAVDGPRANDLEQEGAMAAATLSGLLKLGLSRARKIHTCASH